MSQIISKNRNKYFVIALWSGFTTVVMFWLVMRRSGFNTSYSRVSYLVQMGEYKQLLEAGVMPSNIYLPPHLRLDKISYLDLPETEIACPPTFDITLSEKSRIVNLEHQLPSAERSDLHVSFGPIRTQTIVMSGASNERYVKRRLGVSAKDRERLEREEAEALAKRFGSDGHETR